MSEPNSPLFVSNSITIHRTPITPVKLLACDEFWWITKYFWKAIVDSATGKAMIWQSNSLSGPWEPCEITDRLSRHPG